jgi:aminoglycoside phosphotransferase family enzyme
VTDTACGLEPELTAKIAALRRPESYPEFTHSIAEIETHMSWVFLADNFAYKLKKPIKLHYLDFSTLTKREYFCREELRLNQRLAPGVYIGVVPLRFESSENLSLKGHGPVVEWLVKMRRLDSKLMLDRAIETHTAIRTRMEQLGSLLADFYLDAPGAGISAEDYERRCEAAMLHNHSRLLDPELGLNQSLVDAAHEAALAVLTHRAGEIRARAQLVVEGHGDLRPEHICLESTPIVFDRLEFNRDFRLLDPVDELSYLAMECERLGGADIANIPLQMYTKRFGDRCSADVIHFYRISRACIRARLAAAHIYDCPPNTWKYWRTKAESYLNTALSHVNALGARS